MLWLLWYIRYLTGRKNSTVLIDAHTQSFDKPWSYFKALNRLAMRRASTVIVTNVELQSKVLHNYGINPIILEDRIPDFDSRRRHQDTMMLEKLAQKKEMMMATMFFSRLLSFPHLQLMNLWKMFLIQLKIYRM